MATDYANYARSDTPKISVISGHSFFPFPFYFLNDLAPRTGLVANPLYGFASGNPAVPPQAGRGIAAESPVFGAAVPKMRPNCHSSLLTAHC
jgi:hypothetical protein